MKTLALDPDDLRVESFGTGREERAVRGHEYSGGWSCDSICPTVTDPERCCRLTY